MNADPNKFLRKKNYVPSPSPRADMENVLSFINSKTEPHVYVYQWVSKHAAAVITGQARGNARPSEPVCFLPMSYNLSYF